MISEEEKKLIDETINKIATSFQNTIDIDLESYKKEIQIEILNSLKKMKTNKYVNNYLTYREADVAWDHGDHYKAGELYSDVYCEGNKKALKDITDVVYVADRRVIENMFLRKKALCDDFWMDPMNIGNVNVIRKICIYIRNLWSTEAELKEAHEKIARLETEMKYMPGSSEYQKAKESFEKTINL